MKNIFKDSVKLLVISLLFGGVVYGATVLFPYQGGTGISSYTAGDIIYAIDSGTLGKLAKGNDDQFIRMNGTALGWETVMTGGDVVGPSSATDHAIARFDTTTGKLIQDSSATIDDSGIITSAGFTTATGDITIGDFTQGSVPYIGASGIISENNARLYWDNANLSLNIGGIHPTETVNGVAVDARIVSKTDDGETTSANMVLTRNENTLAARGSLLYGARSRGTHATSTVVQDDDNLLDILGLGYDGTDYAMSSRITFDIDGTPGNDDMPGRIVFKTSSDGSQAPTERMRIDSTGIVSIVDLLTTKQLALTPDTTQAVSTSTATIVSANGVLRISADADYVMTSTPTITAGTDGEVLILFNTGSFTIELQDDGTLAGSDVFIGGTSGVLAPDEIMTLVYNTGIGGWTIQSHPNSPAGVPSASALIDVRNTSGSTIAAGAPVYITGYNVGQGRVEIGLADSDDAAKMPSIGLATASITNNTNGTVIANGVLTGINTSGYSVNDGLYVATTAGTLTNIKPTSDQVQRIGTVTRANASGIILVGGAGRSNDTPWNIDASTLRTGVTAADTLLLQARDVDGAAYTTFVTLTANNTPTWVFNQNIGFGGNNLTNAGSITGTTLLATAGSSLTLGTGSSADGGIIFNNATNANTLTIQSGATSGSYTLTLPLAVAGAGEVLTDAAGNGVLSWTAAGSGDVLSVGDCASGACLDGSADGGTYIRLYDGDSDYTSLVSSNVATTTAIILPATAGTLYGSGADSISSANLLSSVSNETGTGVLVFGTSPTFTTGITVPNDSISSAELSEGDAFVFTGSVALPQGGPTIDSAGEVGIDTTSDQFLYYGGAKRVLTYEKEICFALEDPVDADDNIAFFFPKKAITITDVYCQVDGGTSLPLTISDGTNALEAITCDLDGAEDDGSITNGTFTARERMEFDVGTPTGTQTLLNACITYTITAD